MQTDTKEPCVNAVAVSLKIMNTKIICNLSCLQHTRSAALARPTILAVCDSDTFWFDERVFREFQLHERGWPSSTDTQRASLPVRPVGGEFIALSPASQSLNISSFLPFQAFFPLPLLYCCVVSVKYSG